MFIGIAIFASVVLWLMVKEKGFRKAVFIGVGIAAVIGACVAIWYYAIQLPREARKANGEKAKQAKATKYTLGPPSGYLALPDKPQEKVKVQSPDGVIKASVILYQQNDLSGQAIGPAELNDMVKIVARDNVYGTLRIRDVRSGFEGWVPEDKIMFVTLDPSPVKAKAGLLPCPANDPLGIRDGSTPCKSPSPKKGAQPCPASDPAGLYTSSPCVPVPPR